MDELMLILLNQTAEHRKLVASKASRFCPLNVNVPGRAAFPTEEEEPETPRAQHFRHGETLSPPAPDLKLQNHQELGIASAPFVRFAA